MRALRRYLTLVGYSLSYSHLASIHVAGSFRKGESRGGHPSAEVHRRILTFNTSWRRYRSCTSWPSSDPLGLIMDFGSGTRSLLPCVNRPLRSFWRDVPKGHERPCRRTLCRDHSDTDYMSWDQSRARFAPVNAFLNGFH